MNFNRKKEFFSELGNVPEIPEGLHSQIQTKITRARRRTRIVWSTTAIFVFCIGFVFFAEMKNSQPDAVMKNSIAARDLQAIHNYFNEDDDFDNDDLDILNHYALLD